FRPWFQNRVQATWRTSARVSSRERSGDRGVPASERVGESGGRSPSEGLRMADQNQGRPGGGARRAGDRKLPPRTGPGSAMWYVLGVFLLLALGQAFYFSMAGGQTVSYSEFKQQVRNSSVLDVVVSE